MLRGGLLAVSAALTVGVGPLLTAPAGAAVVTDPSVWYAGAAAVTISPRPYDAARDATEFPLCNTSVFDGPRHFDFEEPYVDKAGTGVFDYTQDPYCDANHNGRHDELYSSGGVDHIVEWVHDDIWVRALAISDGAKTIVIESISSQGLMNEDIDRIRQGLVGYSPAKGSPAVNELFASSTHNESSPDPIGIYGAPDDGTGSAGVYSGIDDYYLDYLVAQAIAAGKEAADALTPASMHVGEIHSSTVTPRLSSTFPTTDSLRTGNHDDTTAATDTKLRILQFRALSDGHNIETILNVAAHNQQIGHAGDNQLADGKRINRAISDDWPGVFATTVEHQLGGQAMFIVADNGSIEDPHPISGANLCPGGASEGCFELADYTGSHWGDDVVAAINRGALETAPFHSMSFARDKFDVPLRNQLFLAAFAGGLFAHRHMATDGATQGIAAPAMQTEVGLIDLGPALQLLINPGEAYPALIEGNPWGEEQAPCPTRPEPTLDGVAAAPAWHATAKYHFEIGLGDDMIGYLIPGPEWFADPAVYADPSCANQLSPSNDPTSDVDPNGHYHKLESESVGPEAGTLVAQHLSALADSAGTPDGRVIGTGRFLLPDGTQTRRASDGAVGIWFPSTDTVVALPGFTHVGPYHVDATGQFVDFDGRAQSAPDIDTRGMTANGTRYFVDVYPSVSTQPGPALPEMRPLFGLLIAAVVLGFALLRRRRRAQV